MTGDERKQAAARALGLLDLTDLTDNCNREAIEALCKRAQTAHGPVAAICIWPRFVSHARKQLGSSGIAIATVVNFPGGNQGIDMTVAETVSALDDGANEIDLVMPYQALLKGDEETARLMVAAVRKAIGERGLLKVIIETGELERDDLIVRASEIAIEAGADFIKTSTGKVTVNATPHAAELMIGVIARARAEGSKAVIGFKPAGGIRTTEDCAAYLEIADRLMGSDWASPRTFRFGASSVLADLLAALEGGAAATGDGY